MSSSLTVHCHYWSRRDGCRRVLSDRLLRAGCDSDLSLEGNRVGISVVANGNDQVSARGQLTFEDRAGRSLSDTVGHSGH